MWRLLRIAFGLFVLNMFCIVLRLASHDSESVWGCLLASSAGKNQFLIDLETSNMISDQPYPSTYDASTVKDEVVGNRLIYNYTSKSGVHRVGVVTNQPKLSHNYLDFAESSTNFAVQYHPSPDAQFIPIVTFDQIRGTQTITLYVSSSLTPLASITQSEIIVPNTKQDAYEQYGTSWSPDGEWFWFLSPTSTDLATTAISSKDGRTFSLSLSGDFDRQQFHWALPGNAVAVWSANHRFIDVFWTDDAWGSAQSFHLDTSTSGDLVFISSWSRDHKKLFFNRSVQQNAASVRPAPYLIFSIETRQLEEIYNALGNPFIRELDDQWYCDSNYNYWEPSLVSVSGDYPPIPLPSITELGGGDPCHYIFSNYARTKLIAPTVSVADASTTWVSLTAKPFNMATLPLPATTQLMIAWLDNESKILFSMSDSETPIIDPIGHVGIFDFTKGTSLIIPYATTRNRSLSISPDSSRFSIVSDDLQHIFLFDTSGKLLATLPTSGNPSIWWSSDSTRFVLLDYLTQKLSKVAISTYTRDGQQLYNTYGHRADFSTMLIVDVAHCEPSLKLPRLNLPS